MHGSHREDGGGDESTEESVNDDEDEEEDDPRGQLRLLPPCPSYPASMLNQNHLQSRKSFPAAKVYRSPPTWKAADEMIGFSVPRKARSASTKRSHDSWASGGGGVGGDQLHHQPSAAAASPVRSGVVPLAPVSPSSSNVSARKKMPKSNGQKQQRPPKTSSKSSSSNQDDIEIEIAEVLYGLRQNQGPFPKYDNDSRDANKSLCGDAKSRVSSPISNSPSSAHPALSSSNLPPHNSNSSAAHLTSTVAPKRKKPRPVRGEDENPGFYSPALAAKAEADQSLLFKPEFSSPNLEKDSGSPVQNGGFATTYGSNKTPAATPLPPPASSPPPLLSESAKPEATKSAEATESKDAVSKKDESPSPKKESSPADYRDDAVLMAKSNSTICEIEGQREKYQIDLMAPPPQLRSSPEREGGNINVVVADPQPTVKTESKSFANEDQNVMKSDKDDGAVEEPDGKKAKTMIDDSDSAKTADHHQPDLERNGGSTNKQHQAKQAPRSTRDEPNTEKTAQSNASTVPLPISVAGWPSGISTMGYMGGLQGVMPMDGSAVSSMAAIQPPNLVFSEPRPKRCATHLYIALNISQHQKFARLNPFWPAAAAAAAAGSASLYGAKPGNLNIVASTELHGHGNVPAKNPSSAAQDKGQGLAIFPLQSGGKEKSPQATNVDAAQRKQQILLQQSLPPGTHNNLLAPAFIFPLNQQQVAVAAATTASARAGAAKSAVPPRGATPSSAPNSATVSSVSAASAAMNFSYPNMHANEAPYVAILPGNGYHFPIPGAPPPFRGAHPQSVPFFSGSFYTSQMLHPSSIQQQQQQPPPQAPQIQHSHQSTSISSVSSNSQKNQQQQQRAATHGGSINNASGNLASFPAPKNRPLQPTQQQQLQHNQHIAPLHQARQLDTEMGSEDSPSTADSRVSRANIVYGHVQPPNFALMTPPTSGGGTHNHSDRREQPLQQQSLKAGVEPHPSQSFAMSFASFGSASAAPGFDISAMAQNPSFLQSLPEHGRHNYQTIAAAAQAAQQKNYRAPEELKKSGASGDYSNVEEERKAMAGKTSASLGQSIAFSRPDIAEASVNNVPENSSRALNHSSVPSRVSGSIMPVALGTTGASNSNSHQPRQNHQQQQMQHQQLLHLHKQQQQQPYVATRSKTPATSNGAVYSENLPSASSMPTKFANLVQNNSGSPSQSPQWKNATRTTSTSQVGSPLASCTPSSLKSVAQQQLRAQQSHTQISFGGSGKATAPQGQQQQPPANSSHHQSASPPLMVGSPTTSSISKGGASGSPRTTTATSTGSKTGQASSLSSQQPNNSPTGVSGNNNKSSPAGGRNISSILGNPQHLNSSPTAALKPPLQQQQPSQQQMPKQALHQTTQLFFNNFVQAQAPPSTNTTSTASAASGYYIQRRRPEKQQQQQGSSAASSTGMLPLCPVTLTGTTTTDPAKAVAAAAAAAAAASNTKGSGLQAQGLLHMAQFAASHSSGNSHHIMPAGGFSYVQSIPSAVQLKAAEDKQPAGE